MSRLAIASISITLMSAMPASAEEPIALRDMGSFHIGVVEIPGEPDQQVSFMGGVPFRIDPSGGDEVEQIYFLSLPANLARPLPPSNVIGFMPNGSPVFCFCSGSSF
jgi:hypothetical protein